MLGQEVLKQVQIELEETEIAAVYICQLKREPVDIRKGNHFGISGRTLTVENAALTTGAMPQPGAVRPQITTSHPDCTTAAAPHAWHGLGINPMRSIARKMTQTGAEPPPSVTATALIDSKSGRAVSRKGNARKATPKTEMTLARNARPLRRKAPRRVQTVVSPL